MAYKDPEKQRVAARRYYLENKRYYLDANKLKRKRIKAWYIKQKEKPCMDCNNKYPYYIMDFDHRDPSRKKYQPHQLIKNLSWKKMKEEILKCDLVCANCHWMRTFHRNDETKMRQKINGIYYKSLKTLKSTRSSAG